MKTYALILLLQMVCVTAGLAQSQPWRVKGESLPARPDLAITWQATNVFPRQVKLYGFAPNYFSPEMISNVMALCAFTEKDKVEENMPWLKFQNTNRTCTLLFFFYGSEITYEAPEIQCPGTNLPTWVSTTHQLPSIAEAILAQLDIDPADIVERSQGSRMESFDPYGSDLSVKHTNFYDNHTNITIAPYREFPFRRLVDGLPIDYQFYHDYVGEHGQIVKLAIIWPNPVPIRREIYPTLSPQAVMDSIRRGDAVRSLARARDGEMDWHTIKRLVIKKAVPSYMISKGRLYPYLYLDAMVDTGHSKVGVGMACPLMDETQQQQRALPRQKPVEPQRLPVVAAEPYLAYTSPVVEAIRKVRFELAIRFK